MSALDLSGKVAVITGAQRGIGLGIVTELAQAGAEVFLTGIVDADGEGAAGRLRETGLDVSYRRMDVTREEEVAGVIGAIVEEKGQIDIAVGNAAIYPHTSIVDIAPDEWDAVMAVNLKGPFLLTKACVPYFKRQRSGRVVFISSITGTRVAQPGYSHYATSKAGVLGFMRTAALEFAPWNITLNAVEPGNIVTEGVLEHQSQSFVDAQLAAVPLHRLGTTWEVAQTVRFLASDEAGYITGQTIVIDGGQTLPEMATAILPQADG